MLGRKALVIFGLFGFSLGAQAEIGSARASTKTGKPNKLTVKKVKLKDGSIVVRLALPSRHQAKSVANSQATQDSPKEHPPSSSQGVKSPQLLNEWLEAVTEPRFMTALATVAMEPGTAAKAMNKAVDPATVRNWAEFVDPTLYMRSMAAGVDPKVSQAIFNGLTVPQTSPRRAFYPIGFEIPASAQAGAPLKPTIWSNAFGDGPSGQEAAQEWLKLPTPDPKANPWLSNNQNYRY